MGVNWDTPSPAEDKKSSSKGGVIWDEPATQQVAEQLQPQGAVSEILQRRGQEFQEIAQRELGGKGKEQQLPTVVVPGLEGAPGPGQDILSFLLQTGGKTGLGTISDLIGAAGSALVPEAAKEVVKSGITAVGQTELGQDFFQAIQGGVEGYQKWAKANPTLAANLEATTNIAAFLPRTGVSAISKNPITRAIENSATEKNIDLAKEIIRPNRDLNTTIAEERLRDTREGGFLGNLSIELNKQEERAAELLGEVYDRDKTFVTNYNTADTFIRNRSEELTKTIDAATTANISPVDVTRKVATDLNTLYKDKPTLRNATSLVNKIRDNYTAILDKYKDSNGEIKPSDLLKVRREFDNWWQTELPSVDFSRTGGNANQAELVVGLFRRATNDVIDAAVPDAKVKEELSDLSSMIRANQNVQAKAISEASKAIERTFNKLGLSQPSTVASNAATLGIGATGIAAITTALTSLSGLEAALGGAAVAGGTLALGATYKILRKPETRRTFVKLVEALDKKKAFAASASLIESVNGLYTSIGEEPLFPEQEQEEEK